MTVSKINNIIYKKNQRNINKNMDTTDTKNNLFYYLQYHMMHSDYTGNPQWYRDRRKECEENYSKPVLKRIEQNVVNSSGINSYFRNRGVESSFGLGLKR